MVDEALDDVQIHSNGVHAHFDCFSGAAGDMLLAACIDAATPNSMALLEQVKRGLSTIPEICEEFDCTMERVIRGNGCIAANKIHVSSQYKHRPAPLTTTNASQGPSLFQKKQQQPTNYVHLTTLRDVQDLPTPEWKRQALLQQKSSSLVVDPPFGGSWTKEISINVAKECFNNPPTVFLQPQDITVEKAASQDLPPPCNSSHNYTRSHSQDHTHSHPHGEDPNHSHSHSHEHSHSHSHHHSHDHTHTTDAKVAGPLRNFSEIKSLINSSKLPLRVKELSVETFYELAKAEAYTHGMPTIDHVHFHEVGAVDSIVDTVGTILALHLLKVSSVTCSCLPLGEGTVMTAHGLLPVPAPATLRLLVGMPTCSGPPGITGELVTPTAAALLKVLASSSSCRWMANNTIKQRIVGRPPPFVVKSVGTGAGTKNFHGHPNILRLILGERTDVVQNIKFLTDNNAMEQNKGCKVPPINEGSLSSENTTSNVGHSDIIVDNPTTIDQVKIAQTEKILPLRATISPLWTTDHLVHMETNIDDSTPEVLAYTMQKLLDAGAIDAWVHPIVMKKGRSAHTLHCICHDSSAQAIETLLSIIFRQTTTLGVRVLRSLERIALRRQLIQRVQTPYHNTMEDGCVDVKLGILGQEIVTISAEFDHCKRVADATDTPLKVVSESAIELAKHMALQDL